MLSLFMAIAAADEPQWRPSDQVIQSSFEPDAMVACIQGRMRKYGKLKLDRKGPEASELVFTLAPLGLPTLAKGRILFSVAASEGGSRTTLSYTHPMDAKSVTKQAAWLSKSCTSAAVI
ncbi:hypothetical protein [Qipengyuania sp.]|jgi:hypothetical protein|uniref:hypothetical protein n=1 Tax=Qipengyuania sp. TaxID=2004515 RepID=UPI0035C7BDDF